MTHDMTAVLDTPRPRDLLVDDQIAAPPSMSIAELAVGFADVCGFTRLSRFVDLPHLDLVLRSFEEVCAAALGDRAVVVKPIGDGVLFAMPEAEDAVDAAVQLVAAARASTVLPPVRVGLAFGWVLTRRHDCFGPAVNLASRLVSAAPAGSVVASESARDEARSRWRCWRRFPHRDLKGIGPVAAWEVAGAV